VLVTRATFTEGGTLSALARSWLTCQSWESVRRPLKLGMPVRRMPFSASQWVCQTGSSLTPVPWKSSGGLGYMPWAMAVSGSAGSPWHISAVRLGDQNWVSVTELVAAVSEARRKQTLASMEKLAAGVVAYRQRNGSPPQANDIKALTDVLHPQYMKDLVLDDGWGHPIELDKSGTELRFRSAGADGKSGTADDIVSP